MKSTIAMTIFKRMFSRVFQLSYEDVFKKVRESNCNYISFDIFDTLIKRNVKQPIDLFAVLEENFNRTFNKKYSISEKRIYAEREAREKGRYEEVTLEEIYGYMSDLSEYEKKWLYEKELELELRFCQRNFAMGVIYDWCVENNKSVFIISDMYLPKDVIVRILREAGYSEWKAVYVSSEERKKKSTGNLFELFLEREKIIGEKMIHIGDSIRGDYIMPKKYGINTYLIPQKNYVDILNRCRSRRGTALDYNVLESFISNNCNSSGDFYKVVGYSVLGPILFGYSKWLYNELRMKGINKVFFLAREGGLLKEAFDILYPNAGIKSCLIAVSRQATVIPLLGTAKSFEEILNYIFVSKGSFTLENLYESCGLTKFEKDLIEKETNITRIALISKLKENEKYIIFNSMMRFIIKRAQEQKELIRGYLCKQQFCGKVAVADVGWYGTIQNALQQIFVDDEIYGFYIGRKNHTHGEAVKNAKGFLFDIDKNERILREVMFSVNLFEMLFLSTDGTTVSYGYKQNRGFYPVKREPEQNEECAQIIHILQKEALRFVDDFNKYNIVEVLNINRETYYEFYRYLVNPPRMRVVNHFRKFVFLSVEEDKLVAQHSLTYYFGHPIKLKRDFLNNSCKLFFLKSLFGIPLPYFKFLCFIKKFDRR